MAAKKKPPQSPAFVRFVRRNSAKDATGRIVEVSGNEVAANPDPMLLSQIPEGGWEEIDEARFARDAERFGRCKAIEIATVQA